MNQDTSALMPELDPLVPDSLQEVSTTVTAQQEVLDSKTQALSNLASDAGWLTIAEQMKTDINDFRSGSNMNFDKDTPMDVIGQKYLVNSLIADKLQQYLDMVSGANEAVYNARQELGNESGTAGAA